MVRKRQGAYVTWADYLGRSQSFIDNLGMIPIYIKTSILAQKALLPVRYTMNFIETFIRLFTANPTYIIVMSQPIFAVIAVYFYAILTRTRFIVDVHSDDFESRKWKWTAPILRFISRRACFVFVTNIVHSERVKSWKCRPMIVGNPPPLIPQIRQKHSRELICASTSIVVVNTFSKGEALEEIIASARLCPDVIFYVTGDKRKAARNILYNLPRNVVLTGWLANDEFWLLLKECSVVLTLIGQDNTILQGGWEAMYLSQPLITTNTGALRTYFYMGTVFVENIAESISEGVRRALKNEIALRAEMEQLRLVRLQEWEEQKRIIMRLG